MARVDEALEIIRADYMERMEAFALTLRPRFEAGELHGFRDSDFFREATRTPGPDDELYGLCEAHFFSEERDGWDLVCRNAYLIRAVSPGESLTEADGDLIGNAVLAVKADVLHLARARGWYVPTPDEEPLLDGREAA